MNLPPLVSNKGVYEITSVVADSMVLLPGEYQADDISFKLFQTPESFTLEITSILNPAKNTSLEGLYKSGNIILFALNARHRDSEKSLPILTGLM